jgi:hypothetical protein
MRALLPIAALIAALAAPAAAQQQAQEQASTRNTIVLGCWSDADRGDGAELKLNFVANGAMVQYDENQVEKKKRTFGAWEMEVKSNYLKVYWPTGNITAYSVKRIGPILHFTGLNGERNFTLREVADKECWQPKG